MFTEILMNTIRIKILIDFNDMIADMINNKKLNSVVNELFIRCRKLNISLVFITQSYFKIPKDLRLNTTHFFITKIPNKGELQQIAQNHSSDFKMKDFINIYEKYSTELNSFLVNDATLASDNQPKYQPCYLAKLISMNILLVKKYYHLINNKQQNKLTLLYLLWEKLAGCASGR